LTTCRAEGTFPSTIQGNTVSDLDLLQGTLDLLILKTLAWSPMHGYGIAQWIRERTRDDLQIEDGALYTALHRLERRGLIEAEWGLSDNNRKAKYYRLTASGRKQLRAQSERWARYARAVSAVLQVA
jgi:PadR family transcriptional regulator PadR